MMTAPTSSKDAAGLVESCLKRVPDSFLLVMLSSYRAKELSAGLSPAVPREGSKDAVLSLKEISSGGVDLDQIRHRAMSGYQKFAFLAEDVSEDTSV